MSRICEKYGINETQLKMMVKDGVISTSWPFYDEIVVYYTQNKHLGKTEAVKRAAEKFNVSEKTIYVTINRL